MAEVEAMKRLDMSVSSAEILDILPKAAATNRLKEIGSAGADGRLGLPGRQ